MTNLHELLIARKRDHRKTDAKVSGQIVYAVGDIHGCYGLLRDLLVHIQADCAARANGRRAILIFLGDYVDRGPQSREVLDGLVWLKRHADLEVHLLKGNHEHCMLSFLDDPEDWAGWFDIGGLETLNSYGISPSSDDEPSSLTGVRDDLLDAMPASHHVLLQSLETFATIGDYAFVHAGVRPGLRFDLQATEDLLWIKDEFLSETRPFERVIVHGHSWRTDRPEILPNRIGIDTGAYETGVLTAVCLQDEEIRVIQTQSVT